MQKFICVGNLTKSPEITETPNGIKCCRFNIAISRPFTNANGERDTDFFNVITWRGQAENCHKYLAKGSKVAIVGTVQNRTYEKNGEKRAITEIIASEVEFVKRSENKEQNGKERPALDELKEDDNLPF